MGRRLLPRTLTGRLVLTSVGLVATVLVLVALVTTLVMGRYLTSRLDQQLVDVAQRATGSGPGGGGGGNGDGDRDDVRSGNPPSGFRRPFSPGTLLVDLGSSGSTSTDPDGVLTEDNTFDPVSSKQRERLQELSPGRVMTVDLGPDGDYRVVVVLDRSGSTSAAQSDLLAVGLPDSDLRSTTHSLLLWSLLLALLGVLLAGGLAAYLVRRQLRPLQQVAATAYDVSTMPLDSGDQGIGTRVDPALTDEATEVGQVGGALNTLLDHVDAALAERHRSEQQVRQFVADASHELRTPLSTIHGYAELSRRTPDDAASLSTAMAKVETEATRMSALVSDLLLLARLDSGRPLERAEVDLTRLLLEAVDDARVVGPDHAWRIDLPDEPLTTTGDELRLHQVVTNLINNARRHTPAGTTVTVGAERAADGSSVVRVHDDGPGLPPAMQEHVFERFTRGDSGRTRSSGAAEGAGLGLSLVKAITEAHGGTASVTSRAGDTTFSLRLP